MGDIIIIKAKGKSAQELADVAFECFRERGLSYRHLRATYQLFGRNIGARRALEGGWIFSFIGMGVKVQVSSSKNGDAPLMVKLLEEKVCSFCEFAN